MIRRRMLLSVVGLVLTSATYAADTNDTPDLQSKGGTAWIAMNNDLAPVPGEVPPTTFDPAHPYVANGRAAQPTWRIADTSNPNLKPWAAAQMKKANDEILADAGDDLPDSLPTIDPSQLVQPHATVIFEQDDQEYSH